jgi:endonuclease/exonuclease/phosphatase family metal-dependent hydrolase
VRADVATPAGVLSVFSTHTARDDCQTRRVADLARAHHSALPAILMGDLNTVETAPALQELLAGGFVDAFRTANPTAAGVTVKQDVTAPTPTARRRIDYVFVLPGTAVTADVVSSRVVLDRPGRNGDGSTLWPSDHYGVFAEVVLRSRSKPRARQRAISSRQAR